MYKKLLNFFDKNFVKIFVIFLVFYFSLLFNHADSPYLMIADEASYSQSVNSLFSGEVGNNNHPLLAKTVWYFVVSFFYILTGADHAFYWRVGTMLFSLGCLVVFYKISRIFFSRIISFVSMLLLAFDPMFFAFSRIVMLDIPALFFLLIFVYFYLKFIRDRRIKYLFISAAALGLSLATKLFALPLIIVIPALIILRYKDFFSNFKNTINSILKFEGLLTSFYILGNFIYFFKRSSQNFLMYTYAQIATEPEFKALIKSAADSTSPAVSWFTTPQIMIIYRNLSKNFVETVVAFQNPIFFAATLIVMVFAIYSLIFKKKGFNILHLQIITVFFSMYLPWFLPIRPTYYYYILPLIPLPIILVIQTISQIKDYKNKFIFALLFLNIAIFATYYPFLIGQSVQYNYERHAMSYSVYKFPERNSVTCQLCSPLRYPKQK
ncbi:MAG TPA: glycosyltransferase family 39 protein [Patescibacteria group bacterium]|nr:glycosyltransferase family 39 protein [Patescibacteria group bacterium]